MGFSIANIITLLLVAGFLLIYRYLDKNNRSLDKVRRFVHEAESSLEEIFHEKKTALQDLSLKVNVHHQAAQEAINHVKDAESALNKRLAEIDTLGKRIDEYEQALAELLKMTQRADENTARIRDESEYIDKVGKRIKIAQNSIEKIESTIPVLAKEFDKKNVDLLEKAENRILESGKEILADLLSEVEKAVSRIEVFYTDVGQKQKDIAEQFSTAQTEFDAMQARLIQGSEGQLQVLNESSAQLLSEKKTDMETMVAGSVERFERFYRNSTEHLSRVQEQCTQFVQEAEDKLQALFMKEDQLETEAFTELRTQIDERGNSLRTEWNKAMEELQFEEKLKIFERKIVHQTNTVDAIGKRIDASVREAEETVLADMEQRLTDYQELMEQRLTNIEEQNSSIDNFESTLESLMNRVQDRVTADYKNAGDALLKIREQDVENAQVEMNSLRETMENLDTELSVLKQEAHDSIKTKLQAFESGFTDDMEKHAANMRQQVDLQQQEFTVQVEKMSSQSEIKRAEIEKHYQEELQKRMQEFQETAYAQVQNMDERINSFHSSMQTRMEGLEDHIREFEITLNSSFNDLKGASFTKLQQEIAQIDTRIQDSLGSLLADASEKIQEVKEQLLAREQEIDTVFSSLQEDMNTWKTSTQEGVEHHEQELQQRLGYFETEISEKLQKLQENFTVEQSELVAGSAETRRKVQEELAELVQETHSLHSQMEQRGRGVIEECEEQFGILKRNITDYQTSVEENIHTETSSLESMVGVTKDKLESMQQKLFAHLDKKEGDFHAALQSIEKRQNEFAEQTKLFEQVDTLKLKLQEDIDSLKQETLHIEKYREELHEVNTQMTRIRRMADDSHEKLSRLTANKNRLEMLEADYEKMMVLSQSVDKKTLAIKNSEKKLHDIFAQLKAFEDMQKSLDTQHQRMEAQKGIVEEHFHNVEKNSHVIQELEDQMQQLRERIKDMPAAVGQLSEQLQQVITAKSDVDTVMEKVEQLDEIMTELEDRIDGLNKARTWLAQTETRLEDISRQSNQQLKLLENLMNVDDNPVGDSAPESETRMMITKLAEQQWGVKEIARATKVSRGEVELILELYGKKQS